MQEYLIAFAVGGTICALSQLLMDKTKLMPGRIMVILVVTGVVLGAFGIYEPFKEWAGAGASVPLLGFGNTLDRLESFQMLRSNRRNTADGRMHQTAHLLDIAHMAGTHLPHKDLITGSQLFPNGTGHTHGRIKAGGSN